MQNKASFDFSHANSLIRRINSYKAQLNTTLKEYEREADEVPAWWEGESRDAFLDRYNQAVPGIVSCLKMMDDTVRYITKVSNYKNDLETKGKNRF